MEALGYNIYQEDNLLRKFEEIHDYIYANDGLSPQQTLNEFLKILFVKIYDEKNKLNLFQISSAEYRNLSSSKHNSPAIQRIAKLFSQIKTDYSDMFDENENIKLSPSALGFTINKLQTISLQDSSSDAKGLAFQKFLTHGEKVGKGQFFTPQPIIDFCVKMINPQRGEKVIDPCCGSGGFIHSAFRHMSIGLNSEERKNVICENLFGVDINKDITKISRMKFLLEENIKSNIHCCNSLGDIDSLRLMLLGSTSQSSGFDVVLTNPPFGTTGKITDEYMLSRFDLGYKWKGKSSDYIRTNTIMTGQPTEILFIERCLDLLKEGGRMAIVLPNGHFENPSLSYLRYYIKQRAKILSVVNLPQETFIPYGTGVKTSLLFLEKDSQNIRNEYPLFFSKITKLGYQGNKNATPIYKKDTSGNILTEQGRMLIDEDFSKVVEDYTHFLSGHEVDNGKSFIINYNELNDRFDYDFYSPFNRNVLEKLESSSIKLGDIVEIVKNKSSKLKDRNATVEYVELSDINTHSFEIINSTSYLVHELPSRATYEIREGDIITGIAGNSVGTRKHTTALVSAEYDGMICTNGFRVLRNPKINPYYLLFYLRSDLFIKQMMMYRTGAAIPNVSDADLAKVLIYLPDDDIIDTIGNTVKRSFELRRESNNMLESIILL